MATKHSIRIDTKTARQALPARREPYWHKLADRQHIGYRKRADGGGNWVARLTLPRTGKRVYQAIGDDIAVDFNAAVKTAQAYFDDATTKTDQGAQLRYTVQQAIDDYVAHLRIHNSEATANQTEGRLTRHTPQKLRDTQVADLTTATLKKWRDGRVKVSEDAEAIRKSKDTANRILSMLKAALNLAFKSGIVASDTSWRRLESFKGVGASRTLFLTEAQVRRLESNATGGLRDLIKAGVLTGARRGELFPLRVRDFDAADGTLLIHSGKTGARTVYLSDTAVNFFKGLAKSKLPEAYLFTKDDGKPWPEDDLQRPFKATARAAKLPKETTFYSLRHYHISRALLAGVQAQVVAENCGTSLRMLEKHYAKFMKSDRRAMFNKVAL